MNRMFIISLLVILSIIQNRELFSQELMEEAWTFTGKDTLSLESLGSTKFIISGSKSGEMEIKLKCISKPDENFDVIEKEKNVYLREYILNYDIHRPTQTYFKQWTWIINVPKGTYIKCSGSSGDFEVTDFNGSFKAYYGSGTFIFNNIDGSIELFLAMLKAKIHNSKGLFNLSSASGLIRAKGMTITGNSSFNSGMGTIKITLADVPEADLCVASNFSRARISFNGQPLTGNFEFISMADEGKIISPFKFDKEETFLDDIKNYRNSSDFGKKSDFCRKSFIRGDSKPKITLKTITGTAQLIK